MQAWKTGLHSPPRVGAHSQQNANCPRNSPRQTLKNQNNQQRRRSCDSFAPRETVFARKITPREIASKYRDQRTFAMETLKICLYICMHACIFTSIKTEDIPHYQTIAINNMKTHKEGSLNERTYRNGG